MYSVLFCASAAGHYLPPLVVFAAEHVYDKWMENGPKDALYTCTPRGYMQGLNFESWFLKVFVEYVKNYEKPVVVIYDGHGSHITYVTMAAARDNNIIVVCLPAHTSHAMQPLDVAVFKSVKVTWKQILKAFYHNTSNNKKVDKSKFASLLSKLWPTLNPAHITNGFKESI